MSKLAVYDKRGAAKDMRCGAYYRNDYIYKKNTSLRFSTVFGIIILSMFYIVHRVVINGVNIFELDMAYELRGIVVIALFLIVGCSVVGTVKHGREYEEASKRLKRYNSMLNLLEKANEETNERL